MESGQVNTPNEDPPLDEPDDYCWWIDTSDPGPVELYGFSLDGLTEGMGKFAASMSKMLVTLPRKSDYTLTN